MSSRTSARKGRQTPRVKLEPHRAYTDGNDAAELVSAYGMVPDKWQHDVLKVWLGRDENDHLTATSCGLSVSRQNGKNGVLEMREMYGMVAMGECILHTAHEVKTARKAFLRLCGFFENERRFPELAAMVETIRRTNGQEAILLKNGASVEFSARSRGAARGYTVSLVVFDEAQELTDEQLEAILPTLAASPTGERQFIYTGTPPSPNSPGDVFARIRADGLAGTDEHLAWHEWSIPDLNVNIASKKLWYETNPGLGIRLSEDFTEQEFRRMTEEGFARERLGWWSETAAAKVCIPAKDWEKGKTGKSPDGKIAFGIKFSVDGNYVAIAAAVKPKSGKIHVELSDYRNISGVGTSWIADMVKRNQGKVALTVIDGLSNADDLISKIHDLGVSQKAYVRASPKDVIASASMMINAVREDTVTHFEEPILDDSATKSVKRPIGKYGAFGFGGDMPEPIEAAAMAYMAVKTTKRNPGRKQRVR